MIGKLLCKLPRWMGGGCLRRHQVRMVEDDLKFTHNVLRCPRCGKEIFRKIYERKVKAAK